MQCRSTVFGCKYYPAHVLMKPRFSPSCDRSCMKMVDRLASRRYSLKNKLGDGMIKQYYYWTQLSQNIDKSQYFAQLRPIIANYSTKKELCRVNKKYTLSQEHSLYDCKWRRVIHPKPLFLWSFMPFFGIVFL